MPDGQHVEVEHLDDVGMADARGDLGLATEAREGLAIAGRDAEQHLDGDALAGQPQVLGRPDRAHAALADAGSVIS